MTKSIGFFICRKQANYVNDEKTEKQPKVLEFGPLLIGTVFAPGKAHFRAVRKNRPVSASTPRLVTIGWTAGGGGPGSACDGVLVHVELG